MTTSHIITSLEVALHSHQQIPASNTHELNASAKSINALFHSLLSHIRNAQKDALTSIKSLPPQNAESLLLHQEIKTLTRKKESIQAQLSLYKDTLTHVHATLQTQLSASSRLRSRSVLDENHLVSIEEIVRDHMRSSTVRDMFKSAATTAPDAVSGVQISRQGDQMDGVQFGLNGGHGDNDDVDGDEEDDEDDDSDLDDDDLDMDEGALVAARLVAAKAGSVPVSTAVSVVGTPAGMIDLTGEDDAGGEVAGDSSVGVGGAVGFLDDFMLGMQPGVVGTGQGEVDFGTLIGSFDFSGLGGSSGADGGLLLGGLDYLGGLGAAGASATSSSVGGTPGSLGVAAGGATGTPSNPIVVEDEEEGLGYDDF
ncbi:hypothetical protein HDU79_004815 [Rhizoclosmatium sp. JEL0117]|nr:hypothetical protein HDU79_004815 [Rhizoclosmatium sp. JEL0117]